MRRQEVRALKRAVSNASDKEAMQALLLRSVRFGHRRLALVRCLQAERMGLEIQPEVRSYCERVAGMLSEQALMTVVRQAAGVK